MTSRPLPQHLGDGAPESVFVLLRDDGSIAGIARDPYEPPRGTQGWAVREYVAAPMSRSQSLQEER